MKLTAILLLITCVQVSAAGYGQRVSISGQNMTLKKVFREIQKQTPYTFFYSDKDIDASRKVTIDARDAEMVQVLNEIFREQLLTYSIIERTIVVKRKTEGIAAAPAALPVDVRGRVVNESGEPVEGVTVTVKGSRRATATDANGEFSLSNINEDAILVVTGINIETKEFRVGGRTNLVLQVISRVSSMEQFVITGYSTKKISEVTGSVQKFSGDELRNGVNTVNPLAMLKGKAAGFYIVENGGSVATRGQVILRGQSSFVDASNPNFGPLIVVDGVITTAANLQDIVNPNDIESITLLKDASSTAIYGSRAAQGVIVVVTKRGSTEGVRLNLNMSFGKVQNNRAVRFMNTAELTTHITNYMKVLYERTASLRNTYPTFDAYFDRTRIFTDDDLKTDYEWDNNGFFTDGYQKDVNLSMTAGTANTKIYAAVNWVNQDGTLLDDNLDRKAARFNLDQKIGEKFSLTVNANALIDRYRATGSENQYYLFQPWVTPYYANGELADSVNNYVYRATNVRGVQYYDNPLYSHKFNTNLTKRQNYLASGRLKYAISPWLSVQSTNSIQYTNQNVNNYRDPRTYRGRYDGAASNRIFINGALTVSDARTDYFLTSNQVNFNRRFGSHSLSAVAGQEWGKIHTETISVSAYNTPYPGERNLGAFLNYGTWINVLQGTTAFPSSTAPLDKASFSVFGEVNDIFMEKYMLSASLRRDASTNFGRDNRYGTFYSFGAGWWISKEPFVFASRILSDIKLRASYGTSGREAGADYLNFTVYADNVRYNNASTTGSRVQRLGNDQITWETTYNSNVGLDFKLFKRIEVHADYYHKRSTDLLQSVDLPTYIGFPSQIRNIGELTNKGFELALSSQAIQSRDFGWYIDFNISFNQNKLTKIYGDSLRDGFVGNYYRYVGDDINVLRAIRYAGVNPDNGRPLFERVMADKSVVLVDSIPLVKLDGLRGFQVVGSATPKFFGGFQNSFSYKRLTLSALFNFTYGNKIFNNALRNFMSPSTWQNGFNIAAPTKNIRFWKGPGDTDANYPDFLDPDFAARGGTNLNSSLVYVDASYLRLRNVRLMYDLPPGLLKKAGLTGISMYVSADNLFVIHSRELYAADPEGATIGSSQAYAGTGVASAMPRRYVFGINAGF